MNSNLIVFLSYLGILPEAIDELYGICSQIFSYEEEKIINNIALVVSLGYPKEDIGELLIANPNFVFSDYEELKQSLLNLGEDIEIKLKQNPLLI